MGGNNIYFFWNIRDLKEHTEDDEFYFCFIVRLGIARAHDRHYIWLVGYNALWCPLRAGHTARREVWEDLQEPNGGRHLDSCSTSKNLISEDEAPFFW